MKETIRMLRVQPSSLSARFAFLAIALRWTLGATPRPNRLMIGPHDLEPVGSECAFWLFAFRHACSGQSILVTRGGAGTWAPRSTATGTRICRRFALRQCLF